MKKKGYEMFSFLYGEEILEKFTGTVIPVDDIIFPQNCQNNYLGDLAYQTMNEVKMPEWTDEEKRFAEELNAKSPRLAEIQKLGWLEDGPLHTSVAENHWNGEIGGGSTDVADVQHICPTVALYTATYNLAGVGHSWQITACAGMSIGFKGMLHGANVMATLAMKLFTDPTHLKNAKDEFERAMNGATYVCPIPKDVPIPQPQRGQHERNM